MSFKLLNKATEKGDYGFTGHALPNQSCNLCCSEEEIEAIKKQISDYTKIQPRDYILTFENANGERLIVQDHISLSEIQDMHDEGESETSINAMNYYNLKFIG